MTSREHLLAETFVELADTLVDDFDVIDFLHTLASRTVELLDVSAAGIMMADQRGGLRVMASSAEAARLLELYELQNDEGPCLDCFRTGESVSATDLPEMRARWPLFTGRLEELGFRSAQAIPMRLRRETIGALNIFGSTPVGLTPDGMRLGQALADVATVGLVQERAISARELLAEQLQTALNSRIVLEQAKGILAERARVDMDESFRVIRDYARRRGLLLIKVAEGIIAGQFGDVFLPHPPGRGRARTGAPTDTP